MYSGGSIQEAGPTTGHSDLRMDTGHEKTIGEILFCLEFHTATVFSDLPVARLFNFP
jgi:hypothetical protein